MAQEHPSDADISDPQGSVISAEPVKRLRRISARFPTDFAREKKETERAALYNRPAISARDERDRLRAVRTQEERARKSSDDEYFGATGIPANAMKAPRPPLNHVDPETQMAVNRPKNMPEWEAEDQLKWHGYNAWEQLPEQSIGPLDSEPYSRTIGSHWDNKSREEANAEVYDFRQESAGQRSMQWALRQMKRLEDGEGADVEDEDAGPSDTYRQHQAAVATLKEEARKHGGGSGGGAPPDRFQWELNRRRAFYAHRQSSDDAKVYHSLKKAGRLEDQLDEQEQRHLPEEQRRLLFRSSDDEHSRDGRVASDDDTPSEPLHRQPTPWR